MLLAEIKIFSIELHLIDPITTVTIFDMEHLNVASVTIVAQRHISRILDILGTEFGDRLLAMC
jgi:hypothetical protein